MSSRQDPKSVSVSEAARWVGVRRQTLTEWLNAWGVDYSDGVSVPEIFKLKVEAEKRDAIEKARREFGGGEDGGDGMTEKEAVRRKRVADALIRENDLARELKAVVPRDAILDAVGGMFSIARSRLLAIPGAEAPDLALLEDEVEVAERLRHAIDAALSPLDEEKVVKKAAGK